MLSRFLSRRIPRFLFPALANPNTTSSWAPTNPFTCPSGRQDHTLARDLTASGARVIHCSSVLLDRVSVEVPAMGDSITEGTIASVLDAGSNVVTDDVIAQIETDKVVIDVKSPVGGVLDAVEVKEGGTVVVGQLIGRITPGGDGLPGASTPQQVPLPEGMVHFSHRVGGISFPTRRTPTGELISAMGVDVAKAALDLAGRSNRTSASMGQVADPQKHGAHASILGGSGWAPVSVASNAKVQTFISASEMEKIMLGGADP